MTIIEAINEVGGRYHARPLTRIIARAGNSQLLIAAADVAHSNDFMLTLSVGDIVARDWYTYDAA